MGAEQATARADAVARRHLGTSVALRELSPEQLARRAGQGCRASFAELVERFAPRLEVFLQRRAHDPQDAQDLVQDTFVKAYQNIERYRDSWRFSTWLYTIAARLAVSNRRKIVVRRRAERREACVPSHREATDQHERRETLWALAETLPANQYRALWLKYSEDLSIKEIARTMRRSPVSVKVLLYRARVALAQRCRQQLAEDVGMST